MLRQLLEKANRKCEMRWIAYVYDPEKDNELIKTSDAFDCIDCAMQFKRDHLAKHCKHIVQIVAESKRVKNEAKEYRVVAYNKGNKVKEVKAKDFVDAKVKMSELSIKFDKVDLLEDGKVIKSTNEFAQKSEAYSEQHKDAWNNLKVGDTVQVTDKNYQFTKKMKVVQIYSNGTNRMVKFDAYTPSGERYTLPLARIYKDTDIYKAESAQKNEEYKAGQLVGDKFTKDYVTILRIVKPNKEYAVEYPNGSRSILTKEELDSFNESAQKNEEYKVGDTVKVDFNWRGANPRHSQCKIVNKRKAMAGKGDSNPGYEYLVKSTDGKQQWINQNAIVAESARKNESTRVEFKPAKGSKSVYSYKHYNDAIDALKNPPGVEPGKGTKATIIVESYAIQNINSLKEATIKVKEICKPANLVIAEKNGLFYDGKTNIAQYLPNAKQLVIFKESAQKNESLNLDSLTDEDAKQLIVHLQDFIKDKSSKYHHIDKIEAILKKKYKAESVKNEDIDDDSTGIVKNSDEKQMTEARGWRVSIKLQSKDNMNNINVEDAVEDALNDAGFTVNDIDAERM